MFCINTESNWLLDKNSIIVYFCMICKFGSNFELPSNVDPEEKLVENLNIIPPQMNLFT